MLDENLKMSISIHNRMKILLHQLQTTIVTSTKTEDDSDVIKNLGGSASLNVYYVFVWPEFPTNYEYFYFDSPIVCLLTSFRVLSYCLSEIFLWDSQGIFIRQLSFPFQKINIAFSRIAGRRKFVIIVWGLCRRIVGDYNAFWNVVSLI